MLGAALKALRQQHQQGETFSDISPGADITTVLADALVSQLPLLQESQNAKSMQMAAKSHLNETLSKQHERCE